MGPHLRLLGVLQVTWGAMGVMLGIATLLLAIGALAIGFSPTSDSVSAGVTGFMFGVFATVLLVGGTVNAWAGRALRRHEPTGRMAVMALAVLNLFLLPFGTALGIYAFWVLLHNETRTQFVGAKA